MTISQNPSNNGHYAPIRIDSTQHRLSSFMAKALACGTSRVIPMDFIRPHPIYADCSSAKSLQLVSSLKRSHYASKLLTTSVPTHFL